MRVLHTESSLGWGGQEIRIMREAQVMAKAGHEVHIACGVNSTLSKMAVKFAPDVNTIVLKMHKKRPSHLLRVRAMLESVKPTIVVCHSSTDHWLVAIVRLFASTKFPIVRVRHISTLISTGRLTRWLYSCGCDAIITTGSEIRESMVSARLAPARKVWSIPTGLNRGVFEGLSKSGVRRQLRLPQGAILIGIVATLRSWKGHEDLIRAFSCLEGNVRLLIVGDGPRMDALVSIVDELGQSGRVMFAGH